MLKLILLVLSGLFLPERNHIAQDFIYIISYQHGGGIGPAALNSS